MSTSRLFTLSNNLITRGRTRVVLSQKMSSNCNSSSPQAPYSSSTFPSPQSSPESSSRLAGEHNTNPAKEFYFPISPIPKNPLGEGRYIRTAAALIIGDEILNGKTLDRNSNYFARYCFEQGIELKRIEVIADCEEEIIEASRRMVRMYDFVVTSGGIGPTHDDITYASLAKSFSRQLVHHPETLSRMSEMNKHRSWVSTQNAEQRAATQRMALFPEDSEVLFVGRDIWVPVVRLEGKLCIFPGIPALFQKMLNYLTPFLPLPPNNERPVRIQIFTSRPESLIAPYLTGLQQQLKPHGIQVGSYPVLGQGVYVSLIGKDGSAAGDRGRLRVGEVAKEVEKEVGGTVVSEEEVARKKEERMSANKDNPSQGHAPVQAQLTSSKL